MSTITVTYYPDDAGTRTFFFEKNNKDKPLTKSYDGGFGFETEVELRQGSLCYFDGLTNLEGRHSTKPLPAGLCGGDDARLVLVIRGRANSNYRASFNRIYSVGIATADGCRGRS
jgi:hypothetical protein